MIGPRKVAKFLHILRFRFVPLVDERRIKSLEVVVEPVTYRKVWRTGESDFTSSAMKLAEIAWAMAFD